MINWFTVAAQLINFLILIGLLTKFLYRPVIQAMKQREEHVTDRLREAEEREKKAKEQEQHYRDETGKLEASKEAILKQSTTQAEETRKTLITQSKMEVDDLRKSWKEALASDMEREQEIIRHHIEEVVFSTVSHILSALADTNLEVLITWRFIHSLENLPEEQRKPFNEQKNAGMVLASSYPLSEPLRMQLTEAIKPSGTIEFTCKPEMICGIELTMSGLRFAWNIGNYLEELHHALDGLLNKTVSVA